MSSNGGQHHEYQIVVSQVPAAGHKDPESTEGLKEPSVVETEAPRAENAQSGLMTYEDQRCDLLRASSHYQQVYSSRPSASTSLCAIQSPRISFTLAMGFFSKKISIEADKMTLGLIKRIAIAYMEELYFKNKHSLGTFIGEYMRKHLSTNESFQLLCNNLILKKFDPEKKQYLDFNSVLDISPDSLICVEVSGKFFTEQRSPNVHLLSDNSPDPTSSSTVLKLNDAENSPLKLAIDSSKINNQRSGKSPKKMATSPTILVRMSHDLKSETYLLPTYCSICTNLILGVYKQGFTCHKCKRNFCGKCKVKAEQTGNTCLSSSLPSPELVAAKADSSGEKAADMPDCSKRKSTNHLVNLFKGFNNHGEEPQAGGSSAKGSAPDEIGAKAQQAGGRQMEASMLLESRQDFGGQGMSNRKENNDADKNLDESCNLLTIPRTTHLSNSHQNLYTQEPNYHKQMSIAGYTRHLLTTQLIQLVKPRRSMATGDESLPSRYPARGFYKHSNSGRASADVDKFDALRKNKSVANHQFVSMDWIEISNELVCGVCAKQLRTRTLAPPVMCRLCVLQVHDHCKALTSADCFTRMTESSRAVAGEGNPKSQDCIKDPAPKQQKIGSSSNVSCDTKIRLHRLAPSVKRVKQLEASKPIVQGWLRHTMVAGEQVSRYYWKLDKRDLSLYENEDSKRYFKAIDLHKIERVISWSNLPKKVAEDFVIALEAGGQQASTTSKVNTMFAFELDSGAMFLVEAPSESEAIAWKKTLIDVTGSEEPAQAKPQVPATPFNGITKLFNSFSKALPLRRHEMGDAPRRSVPEAAPWMVADHASYGDRNLLPNPIRTRLPRAKRKTIIIDHVFLPDHLVQGEYLIERDNKLIDGIFVELGSGMFGKVYSGIAHFTQVDQKRGIWSGVPVAIKEISKERFSTQQRATLQNEAEILSRLNHPGVIMLDHMHDTPEKIFIIMEQMEDDMLEFIISTEDKRLNERVSKFLTYQILEALKYLHHKNVVHCDLKPENVLLVECRSQYPQIKLCDFGFAKIIDDNSFKCSLVGTPAYLAPEVVRGQRYNRSVDLWSVGVIVYVSLSGEFPFSAGETIPTQISRADFLFPEEPWSNVSKQAKIFINSLLKVDYEKRSSATRAQMSDWLQDYQLWCDLNELEARAGTRWVTDKSDYQRWTRYAKEHKLVVPRSATQILDVGW